MGKYYLGIDLGSSYTKFVLIDNKGVTVYDKVVPTFSRRREEFNKIFDNISKKYSLSKTCATGYGRNSFNADFQKTELICASIGVSTLYDTHKCIVDIGGEDIKIVESGPQGEVINFTMNDKCSAGTGAFITEIAEKAELDIEEMSELASISTSKKMINSFCTVFAKTEILEWKFNGVQPEDIAKGIYLSIINRISKLPMKTDLPLYLCGGVIAYHPYLGDLLSEELKINVRVTPSPQLIVALGAAKLAQRSEFENLPLRHEDTKKKN